MQPQNDESSAQESIAYGGLKVLVVDDSQDTTYLIALVLSKKGFEVRLCYDGSSALVQAVNFKPKVILMDIGLPDVDGFSLCQKIRGLADGPSILMIAQSAWAQAKDRQKALDVGFDYFLAKPFDMADLLGILGAMNT